ncbi:hypothetical protein N7489_008817 [Penicillium chrysogenum]|uniref:Uncharacterized protein n=1 Tax=Penicillium chrysogenum TaxID=5076 RepID=A0ABQ8WZW9_PENCH|nr:uncharacterized protein N7489_008817 [Penicillium chrysogenum]KAJ5228109.1 hypothetical protein N7489_008817 [Penicillium chrysogenum]KAJ5284256.1 hypothetical protein N7505_002236 [Penicillium chrysogenum]
MKENATTAVKVLYHIVVDELYTCYFFMKDNADAYLPPIAIFTTASLLHRVAFVYACLYGFNSDVANNIGGGMEDIINKPYRPLASKATTLAATKARYVISTVVYLAYTYILNIHKWSVLWIFTVLCACFLRTSRFGPTKDLSMVLGTIAELMASWKIGGSSPEVGWSWVKKIIWWVFTVAVQDYRDVPGDLASGRRTIRFYSGTFQDSAMIS